jgi:hypothetical protein
MTHLFFLTKKNNSEPHTEVCNRKAAVATSADWVNIAVNKVAKKFSYKLV